MELYTLEQINARYKKFGYYKIYAEDECFKSKYNLDVTEIITTIVSMLNYIKVQNMQIDEKLKNKKLTKKSTKKSKIIKAFEKIIAVENLLDFCIDINVHKDVIGFIMSFIIYGAFNKKFKEFLMKLTKFLLLNFHKLPHTTTITSNQFKNRTDFYKPYVYEWNVSNNVFVESSELFYFLINFCGFTTGDINYLKNKFKICKINFTLHDCFEDAIYMFLPSYKHEAVKLALNGIVNGLNQCSLCYLRNQLASSKCLHRSV